MLVFFMFDNKDLSVLDACIKHRRSSLQAMVNKHKADGDEKMAAVYAAQLQQAEALYDNVLDQVKRTNDVLREGK